jgi:NAD(P)-dependent dehydrogenase (short-subunit alcohol dehydrogenase family)
MTGKPVALVTGASRGIGLGIALRLGRDGHAVIISSRTADPAKGGASKAKRTIERDGGTAAVFRADISDREERRSLVEFVEREFPRIDLLVNNAGVEPAPLDMLESTEERFDQVMAVNLKGPYFLTQAISRRMIEGQRQDPHATRRIIFVTSVQAYMSNPHGAEYCLTKAALHAAMRNYAHRLAAHGVLVFEISPGIIESDMSLVHKENIDRQIAAGRLLTSRWGRPDDVAAVVSSIARGDLDYSTGSTIEVGGGLGLRRL